MDAIQSLTAHLEKYPGRLYGILQFWATKTPERPYFFSAGQWQSYGVVHDQALKLAQVLQQKFNLLPGSAIAFCIHNFESLVPLVWASLAAGYSLAFLPQNQDPALTRAFLSKVNASYLISDDPTLSQLPEATSVENLLNAAQQLTSIPTMTANEAIASFILHTSGTTGDSKWVKLTELQFLKAIRALAHAGGLHHAINQYTYLAPPLTHSYGLSAFLEYTFVGSAIALAPTLQPLSVLSGLTRKPLATEITALEGVPDFYRFLAKFSRKVDVPNLRHIGFGGGSVDLDAVSWLSERSSPLTCSIRYGLTETPSIVSHKVFILSCQRDHGATLEEYRLSSGKILPIYDVRIMNELGQLVPPEHEGEIFIQGDCLGLPYLGEMSTQTGHFATGDLGYLNAEEELVIVGRKSLFIKHKGFRISPEMVESAILSLETIVDCRVLIKNDELVAEMVRQDPNTSTQEVFQSIKSKLPSYALPTTLCWVEHLPRTLSGKLKRYEGA